MELPELVGMKIGVNACAEKRSRGVKGKHVAKENESISGQIDQSLRMAFRELWANIEGSKRLLVYWTLANWFLMFLSLVVLSVLYVIAIFFVNHFVSLTDSLNYISVLSQAPSFGSL